MKKFLCVLLSVIMLTGLLCGCSQPENKDILPVFGDKIEATDYSQKDNWLNIPDTDYEVDVFYLYPTAWTRQEGEPYYCEADNASLRNGASYIFTGQAAAFETVANVYAPFYRQIDAVWALENPLNEAEPYFEGIPLTDAVAAFEYYLEHYNNGKPFILAGHSQGSSVTKGLLKYYMAEHPDVYKRMVAAYVIGYYVSQEELAEYTHLKFAKGADDTGVIISWNVESPDADENPLIPDGTTPISINPITWTLTEEPASAEQSLGALIADRANQTLTEMGPIADARVNTDRGTVVCSTVDVDTYAPGTGGLFPRGVYHMQDYGFYFYDIRANAEQRIRSYLEANK